MNDDAIQGLKKVGICFSKLGSFQVERWVSHEERRFNMNIRVKLGRSLVVGACLAVALSSGPAQAQQTSAWTVNSNGSWTNNANWNPAGFATGVTAIAYFTNDISANRIITNDVLITLGQLWIGDANGAYTFTITNKAGGSFVFDNGADAAVINKVRGGLDAIYGNMALKSNLILSNSLGSAGVLTLNGTISDATPGVFKSLIKEGGGMVILGATNTFGGQTVINGGVLRILDNRWLNASSNLLLNGGVLEFGSNNYTRTSLGTGSNSVQILGGASGFSVYSAQNNARSVVIGSAGSSLQWGSTYFNPDTFVLQSSNANKNLTLDNSLDLNGAVRNIEVQNDMAILTRAITNSTGSAGLTKTGNGTLRLDNDANNWDGPTTVNGGVLRIGNATFASSALPGSNLVLSNGVVEINYGTAGSVFTRALGTGPDQVYLAPGATSGFSAVSAPRTFNLGGDGHLIPWGVEMDTSVLVLNEATAGAELTFANGIDLNGANRQININANTAVLAGLITNTGVTAAGLIKAGGGTLLVTDLGANYAYDGPTIVKAGNLQLGDYRSSNGALPGAISNSAGTVIFANATAQTISNTLSGAGTFAKFSSAPLTLTGSNSLFTGALNAYAGELILDYSAANAPSSGIGGSGSALGLQGGTLTILGGADGVNSQIFKSATVAVGSSTIVVTNLGATMNLVLSNITRAANNGGVVDFNVSAGGSITTTNKIVASSFGILGGYATMGHADWATVNANSNVVAYTAYTEVSGGSTLVEGSNLNVRISGAGDLDLAATTNTLNTLMLANDGQAHTIATSGKVLRLGAQGGVLLPSGAGALTIGAGANDGMLTAGLTNNSAGELILQNNSASPLTINAALTNNGSGALTVTIAGAGSVTFNGNNAYNGNLFIVGGGTVTLAAGSTNTLAAGTLNLNQGSLLVSGVLFSPSSANEIVGNNYGDNGTLTLAGTGAWIRTNTASNVYLGNQASSRGVLNIQDTAVYSNRYRTYVGGNSGTGIVNQTGGTYFNQDNTYLGNYSAGVNGYGVTGVGLYVLDGGLFTNGGTVYVGNNGLGEFTQNGGAVGVGGLTLGSAAAAQGIYRMGSGTLFDGGTLLVGNGTSSRGAFTLSGGDVRVVGALTVAGGIGSMGTFMLSGGTLTNVGTTTVGGGVGSVGAMIQTNGAYSGAGLNVSTSVGGYGFYQLTGGAMSNSTYQQVGNTGIGLFYLQGGTNTLTSSQGLLTANGAGTGVIYIAGGTVNSPTAELTAGWSNTGRGEITIDTEANVILGAAVAFNRGGTTTNFLNLNGGVLQSTKIYKNVAGGLSVVNFNGGLWRLGAGGTVLGVGAGGTVGAVDAAYVWGGGAFIDSSNFTATIAQSLLAPTGSGVTGVPWSGNLGGYSGAPYVALSGGSGIGATAVALFNYSDGTVTGLVITSAGVGYQPGDTVSVTLTGGGKSDVTLGSAALAPNTSGGLTKLGLGTLILGAMNTYGGQTVLNGGVLRVPDVRWIDASSNLLFNGGVLEIVSNNFARSAGLGAASNQVQLLGGSSGFSIANAVGNNNRSVTIGAAGSSLQWGSTYFNPDSLVLQYSNATYTLTLDNALDLHGATRTIEVDSSVAAISRPITNSTGSAGLTKTGAGTLILGGANAWDGVTTVNGGALRISANLAVLPANNALVLDGGLVEFAMEHPYLNPAIGSGAGKVTLTNDAGFGTYNKNRTVNINGNTNLLMWGGSGDPLEYLGALLLNGANAMGAITLGNGLDLNGQTRTVTVGTAIAVLGGLVTNTAGMSAGLVKAGGGTLLVLGDNFKHDDAMTIAAGTVQLGDFWNNTATLPGLAGHAGSITNKGALSIANPGDMTLSGNIVGSGQLIKYNRGTLTLTGTNAYTGNTTINRGTLTLDFAAAGAPVTNIIGTGAMSALYLGNTSYEGGLLNVQGAAGADNYQVFKSLTVNQGASAITAQNGAGGSMTLLLSNITRSAGGVLDFTLPASGQILSKNTNVNGIINGALTVGGVDWAASNSVSGGYAVLGSYADYTVYSSGNLVSDGTRNVQLKGNVGVGAGTTTINTLALTNDAGNVTLALGDQTLRLGTVGGILVPPGAGALTIGSAVNDGFLTAGGANNTAGELVFINNSSVNPITVNAAISNNGTASITLTKAGSGAVNFVGDAIVNGSTYLLGGAASFNGTNTFAAINVAGGNLVFGAGSSNTLNGTMTLNAGTVTIQGPVSMSGTSVIQIPSIAGGRAQLFINNDVTGYRLQGLGENLYGAGATFQSNGTVRLTYGGSGLDIAEQISASGYYALLGGTMTGDVIVAYRGNGVLDLRGGTLAPSNQFRLAQESGYGLVNVYDGGLLNAPGTSAGGIGMNGGTYYGGTSVLNLLGGMVNAAFGGTGKAVDLMLTAGNTSYLNLNAGVLTASVIKASYADGLSVLNLNGGTLVATASTNLIAGLTAAYVYPGGAHIDSDVYSVTNTQGLLTPAGYGLASLSTNNPLGGQYLSPPIVQITGGSGTGALAIAELDFSSGSITNFRVVNPGSDYQASDVLTVTLVGGGPLAAPASFTISGGSLATNFSGGLTKNGAGMLILAGTNTFTGPINVNAGLLDLVYAAPGTTNITLGAGAAMVFGVGTANQLSESVITNLLATRFSAGNSFGLDTSSGNVLWSNSIGGITHFYKMGDNTLELSVANTYTGDAYVLGGALRAEWGSGLPATANLVLSGGAWETTNGIASNWGAGAGQFQLPGGAGGFSAYNTPLTVNLGGSGEMLVWGGTNIFSPSVLVLQATTANTNLTFVNPIDLNGATRTFSVESTDPGAIATMTGNITNTSAASAGITKIGSGTLEWKNIRVQTSNGLLTVNRGTLLLSDSVYTNSANVEEYIGYAATDAGTLTLAGDSVFAKQNNYLNVGQSGTGILNVQDNAMLNVVYRLRLANAAGSTGIVHQTGGTVLLGNEAILAEDGVGLYYHENGALTNTSASINYLGVNSTARGTFYQNGGPVRLTGELRIGVNSGSEGLWRQNGGSVNIGGNVVLAYNAGAKGAWNQTDGAVRIAGDLYFARSGYGFFQMAGGSLTNSSWMRSGDGVGLLYMTGGSITNTAASGQNGLLTGYNGTSVVYMAGGSYAGGGKWGNGWAGNGRGEITIADNAHVDINSYLYMNNSGTTTNIFNLTGGGVLQANAIYKNVAGGYSMLNFNGGIFQAGAANTTIGSGGGVGLLDAAYIWDQGTIFDTGVNNLSIAQSLLAPTGQGVTTIPWSGSLSNYLGAPYVSISGGSGVGATAVALFNFTDGTVTGLVITSAGVGYQPGDNVSVTLMGGGNANVELGHASLGANATSGGLTKLGAGTLTLSGTNTYGGATIVNAGRLQLDGQMSLYSNTPARWTAANIVVSNGAALGLSVGGVGDFSASEVQAIAGLGTAGGGFANGSFLALDTTGGAFSYGHILANPNGGAHALGLIKTGANTLTLTAANTYTGGTLVNGGTLAIGINNALLPTGHLMLGDSTGVGHLDLSTFSQTLASLTVASTSAALTNAITIGAGQTLTINGTGGLTVGVDYSAISNATTSRLTITGGGVLVVTNPAANVTIGKAQAIQAGGNTASLDLSGLASVTFGNSDVAINELRVGYGIIASGLLTLSDTSNTITATRVQIGNSAGGNPGTGTLILGAGVNELAVDTINIGLSKANGTLQFASQVAGSPGTVTIGGKTGTTTDFVIGSKAATGTANAPVGILDLRGHSAQVTADMVTLGKEDGASAYKSGATGYLYFDGGVFTASNLIMAAKTGNSTGTATAVLAVGGGEFTVLSGGSFSLASQTGPGAAVGTLTLSGGVFRSYAPITVGPSNCTSTINLNGGMLDMTGNNIGGDVIAGQITAFNVQSGMLLNLGEFNNGAPLVKTTTGTLILSGVNGYTGGTIIQGGTLNITNDALGAAGTELTLSNNGTLQTSGDLTLGNRAVTLQTGGGKFSVDINTTLTITNNITAAGGTLTKLGAGTLLLAAGPTQSLLTNGLNVSAGTLWLTNNNLYVGNVAASIGLSAGEVGRMIMGGDSIWSSTNMGTDVAHPALFVGNAGQGTLIIQDNAIVTNKLYIGNMAGSAGAVYQRGGSAVWLNGRNSDGRIGMTGYGYYELSGGEALFMGYTQIGRSGVGVLSQLGGMLVQSNAWGNTLALSRGGVGVFNMLGGNFVAPSLTLGEISDNAGSNGVAIFNMMGGDVLLNGDIKMGDRSNMTYAIVNLDGGVLTANAITKAARNDTLTLVNFNGGTLQARQAGNLFGTGISAPDGAYIYAGGATIDAGNFNLTVAQGLLAPQGAGVTNISLGALSLPGYIGSPYVRITGGGGTGATAFAQFDSVQGLVTGIVMTSYGYGYTEDPVVTLLGSTTNTLTGMTLAVNLSGGLTKLGTGTLTLSGQNTYGGATVISNGLFKVANGGSLSSGTTVYVDALGTFDLDRNSQTIAGLTGRGVVTNGTGGSLTLNLINATNTFGGVLHGASAFTLTGGGTLIMTGTNSFGGSTVVSNANLVVNGLHNGGVIMAFSNSVVSGTGSLSSLYVDHGGTYAPGNSIATTYVGNLTLTNAGMLELELGAGVNDKIFVTNSLTIKGGQLKLNLAAYSYSYGTLITLIDYNGALGYNADDPAQWFTLNDFGGDYDNQQLLNDMTYGIKGGTGSNNFFHISYNAVANGLPNSITLTAVPEPGTASLLGLMGVAWLVRQLRRRQTRSV